MDRAPWLADVLRAAGCPVVECRGWRTRGRDFADLRAVVWHHDASPRGDSPGVPAYMLRQMAAGKPAAQLWVDRKGTWHILAAGVAGHAGKVRPGMPGNSHSLGVETDHTTGEAWPAAQVSSLRRGTAAILRHLGQGATGLHMHKTICSPPGRKTDPDGLDLTLERVKVAELLRVKSHASVPPTPIEDEMTPADWTRLNALLDDKIRLLLRGENSEGKPTGHNNLRDLAERLERIEAALGGGTDVTP